jgi:pyruvate dehydrogenase E2 component (dihydrolipoamide acetyltransferase)
MPIEILMPALSPTMTEGTLAKWIKKEGDAVKSGDVIAEIETDKATMEVEAVDEGVLGKIVVAEGTEGVAVNSLIALLLADGESAADVASYAGASAPKAAVAETSAPALASAPTTAQPSAATNNGDRVFISPLAKRIAEQEGINYKEIAGTGPHGRIIKADVEDALKGGAASKKVATPAFAVTSAGRVAEEYTSIPNSGMRKTIAKRLTESKQQVPHFYLSLDCELDTLLEARKQMNDAAEKAAGKDKPAYKLSVNDMVIKAVAMALRDVPAANASWTDAAILQYNNVDISVAVAIDGGLITPIVKNADQKGLAQISNEAKDLIARARAGKLQPSEYQGGGFSISNLGMYGIKNFNAIINPPQGCILAVGAGEERVVVKGGQFKAVMMMTVTLSCDHRVVDGAVGAEFLSAFKRYIETPVLMLA